MSGDAFQRLYRAAMMSTGQICHAIERLHVHKSRFDQVVEGLKSAVNARVIGEGLLPSKSGIGRNFGHEGVIQFQGYHSIAGAPGSLL